MALRVADAMMFPAVGFGGLNDARDPNPHVAVRIWQENPVVLTPAFTAHCFRQRSAWFASHFAPDNMFQALHLSCPTTLNRQLAGKTACDVLHQYYRLPTATATRCLPQPAGAVTAPWQNKATAAADSNMDLVHLGHRLSGMKTQQALNYVVGG